MLSLEIFRNWRQMDIERLISAAGISRRTYYNFLSGRQNVTHTVLGKLDSALNLGGMLFIGHFLDRLYIMNSAADPDNFEFPESCPYEIQRLLIDHHPFFKAPRANIIHTDDISNTKQQKISHMHKTKTPEI